MGQPLLISSLLRHAETCHADTEIVSRIVEPAIGTARFHRYASALPDVLNLSACDTALPVVPMFTSMPGAFPAQRPSSASSSCCRGPLWMVPAYVSYSSTSR